MKQCRPGIYRVTRFSYSREAVELIGYFAIVDGAVVFFLSVDRHNCDFIGEGPIDGYTASRISFMLANAMGTACLHLEWLREYQAKA